jgi:hypothetical protein
VGPGISWTGKQLEAVLLGSTAALSLLPPDSLKSFPFSLPIFFFTNDYRYFLLALNIRVSRKRSSNLEIFGCISSLMSHNYSAHIEALKQSQASLRTGI